MDEINKRIFVVGCSRSGTTLLQVLLASHPDLTSFPETNFFWSATGGRRRILARFGLPTGLEPKAIRHTLDLLKLDQGEYSVPRFFATFGSAVDEYIRILDTQAVREGKSMWLEKTPLHVCRIDFIEKYVDDPVFVHIVRDGREVVASICDRAREYPDRFGWQRDPSYGIDLWNRTVARSIERVGRERHVFTTYDRIVRSTEDEVKRLCSRLNISFYPEMAEGNDDAQEKVIPQDRPWIHGAKKKPEIRSKSKFDSLFDSRDKSKIISKINIKMFKEIGEFISSN